MSGSDGAGRRDNVEQVYRRVREAILEGEIAPGTVMSQVALADELGVSRTPLREALRMLQSEGLVDAQANRRVTVTPVSAPDLEELVVMRVALETEAIRLSVERLGPEDLAALEGRLAEMTHFAEAKDYTRWSPAQRVPPRAHGRGRPARQRAAAQLSDHFERYRRMHIARSPKAWLTEGHREILDAVKAGDRALGAGLLADHLSGPRSTCWSCSSRATSPRGCGRRSRTSVPSPGAGADARRGSRRPRARPRRGVSRDPVRGAAGRCAALGAPAPPEPWSGELDATRAGPPAPQPERPISEFAWGRSRRATRTA